MVVRRHRSLRCRLGRRKSVENALEAHDMPTSKNKRNLCTYTEKGTPRCCDDARGGYQDRSERTDVDRSCQYDQHNESAGGTSGTVKCDGGTAAMVQLPTSGNAECERECKARPVDSSPSPRVHWAQEAQRAQMKVGSCMRHPTKEGGE